GIALIGDNGPISHYHRISASNKQRIRALRPASSQSLREAVLIISFLGLIIIFLPVVFGRILIDDTRQRFAVPIFRQNNFYPKIYAIRPLYFNAFAFGLGHGLVVFNI